MLRFIILLKKPMNFIIRTSLYDSEKLPLSIPLKETEVYDKIKTEGESYSKTVSKILKKHLYI